MSEIEIKPYDGAKYFRDPDDQARLLTDAFASGDCAYIAQALGTVARAHGIATLAFSRDGSATLESLLKVLATLKLELRVERAP